MVYKAGDTPITEQWVQTQNEPNDNLQARRQALNYADYIRQINKNRKQEQAIS